MNRKLMRMLIVAAYILLPVFIAAVSLRNRSFLSAGPPFLGSLISYTWAFDGSRHRIPSEVHRTLLQLGQAESIPCHHGRRRLIDRSHA